MRNEHRQYGQCGSREARFDRRVAELYATDPQFAAADPIPDVTAAANRSGLRLPEIVDTILTGYARRPALGQRKVEFVLDPNTGRTTARLLPAFETITYQQLAGRVDTLASNWADNPVQPGDRVAILGFTSLDYTTIDLALMRLGAVSVPLQTGMPPAQLRTIVAETEPTLIATSVAHLDEAVIAVLASPASARLVVFDFHPEVDDDREALSEAAIHLVEAGSSVPVGTLASDIRDGLRAPAPAVADAEDPLTLLIYTSGSTGAPKGAMYRESKIAKLWCGASTYWDETHSKFPSITLSFMPMSHIMGRQILYGSLSTGGTVYFAARSDLSTFLEDLELVRPTQLVLVPRVWDMIYQHVRSELDRRVRHDQRKSETEAEVVAELRQTILGGRFVNALSGSAPISTELKEWIEAFLDIHLVEGYGSTEAGSVLVDGLVRRPPVVDYKLVDVADLGYFSTDLPYPRGELLVKTEQLFPGYYKRPDITAAVFDEDGYYRTGDVFAQIGPDHLQYVDRRNNVLKLSQGEFVTLSKLEAAFSVSPLVRQIFLYGNSSRSFLLAVVVPTEDAIASNEAASLRRRIAESLQETAITNGLRAFEIPRDFLIETTPFTQENGLLTGVGKLAWPKLKSRYASALEELYTKLVTGQADELQEIRQQGADGPVLVTVVRAAGALLGIAANDVRPEAHFADLGGDSLSALTFADLLFDIFDIEVPVSVIVSPANDLQAIADHIENQRLTGVKRPSFSSVHGAGSVSVGASELSLGEFIDSETLAVATGLAGPAAQVRTVLLTGATGFLGRYLAIQWLERMALVGGTVVCLVRARDDAAARERLDRTFDSGDPGLLAHYRELAADHLEVISGDIGAENLGLDPKGWQRLADTVDLIVHPAALVNHVLPYSQLFGPNVLGTAELLNIALTTRLKPFVYISTIAVGAGIAPGHFLEDADVREMSPTRAIDDSYANGYGSSKWAGEVLLREANDLCGLPVSVFRCDMILADTTYAGQLNVPDMFTRMMLSLLATGIAPESFYELDAAGQRQPAHYDGLPVEFVAEAISTLGSHAEGFHTFHVMNPYDDGIGLDEFVDWLVDAGYPIQRIADYSEWLARFETALRGLPERQRQNSLLPLMHNYRRPKRPVRGSIAPADQFRAAVQEAKIGPDKDIPHVSQEMIVKYASDLELLGLLEPR